jgi:hypothetical protein
MFGNGARLLPEGSERMALRIPKHGTKRRFEGEN